MSKKRKRQAKSAAKPRNSSAGSLAVEPTRPMDASAPHPVRVKSNQPPILVVRDLYKRREKGGQVFELRVPEMVVRPGELIAIAGESGCGKSTLLDMFGLVLQPTSAASFTLRTPSGERQVTAMNRRQLAETRRVELGYILQTGGLLPFLNVIDNILLPCRVNGMRDSRPHAEALCDRLKISNQLKKKPAFLSGGQRQRVAIARALSHRPPLVLADEPTAAVDKITASEIRDTLVELARQMQVAVLIVTHDVDLIRPVADRLFTFDIRRVSAQETQSICREASFT